MPEVGQPGKDVVWVPTPEETVAKMMEVGKITPQDFVIDLGSGDGRNVIAAAKRGARGLGVEYNPDMVELSKKIAAKEGVAERAQFVQGDMYQADFSKATVLALFLLPSNLRPLRDKIFNLPAGHARRAEHLHHPGLDARRVRSTVENCRQLVHGPAQHRPRQDRRHVASAERHRGDADAGVSRW